jgi:transposase
MGLGRPKVALILTDDERVRLDSLAHRSRTAPHLARRADHSRVARRGTTTRSSRNACGCRRSRVCKWRGRFVRERLDGLYDEPGPGTPRQISDEQIEQVVRFPLRHLADTQAHA